MVAVNIFKVVIEGDIGGAGLSRFAVGDGTGAALGSTAAAAVANGIIAAYNVMIHNVMPDITFTVQPTYQVHEELSGALIGEYPVTPTTAPAANSGQPHGVAGTGARVYWHTNTIKNRRFIRGATFLTTLDAASFDSDGGLTASAVANAEGFAFVYLGAITAASLIPYVYSRPKTTTSHDGTAAAIIQGSCSRMPCALRSRRS